MVLMVALPWWDWERHSRLWISDFGIVTLAAFLNAEQEEHEYEGRKELDQRGLFVSPCEEKVFLEQCLVLLEK